MPVLETALDPRGDEARANAAAMRAVTEELRTLAEQVRLGGGEAARRKHLGRGKLLPRDRIRALIDPASGGELLIEGQRVDISARRPGPELRSKVQMVFQNPYGNLNPRQKIGDVLTEPLVINTDVPAAERRDRARAMLQKVGLMPEHYNRYPHMFSGGQRQRIAIARALMLNPSLLVLDEPVSALDLSVQAQVLNLLADLQDEMGLTYVFVSHDLSVVRYIADEVMVISEGEAVEQGPREAIFANPTHPYTRQLFAATPVTDVDAIRARVARRKAARQAVA